MALKAMQQSWYKKTLNLLCHLSSIFLIDTFDKIAYDHSMLYEHSFM